MRLPLIASQENCFDARCQLIGTERLRYVVVRTELEPLQDVLLFALSRHKQDGNSFRPLILFERSQHFESRHQRHHNVEEDEVRNNFLSPLQGSLPVLHTNDIETAIPEFVLDKTADMLLVFCYKNGLGHSIGQETMSSFDVDFSVRYIVSKLPTESNLVAFPRFFWYTSS
jgi:hypothetical protein